MFYIYDETRTVRVAELKLMTLDEFKEVTAQVDSPTQAREMATIHSPEAVDWVISVIKACNEIHRSLDEANA